MSLAPVASSREYDEGYRDALRELADEAWTKDAAAAYLAAVRPHGGSQKDYAEGFDDAVRAFAEGRA